MDWLGPPRVIVDVLGAQAERLAQQMRCTPTSASRPSVSSESLKEAARSFEAIFLSMLIKQLRTTLHELGEGLFGEDQADVYGGLFDFYLGQHLAQHSGVGLARLIEEHYATQSLESSELNLDERPEVE
ncbi:MAG: hypothetical protein RMI91_06680 [Gemmatales bacterium]|nr:hypothetical protein [Gemmatales bacterium]MDW7994322.1 hypothetical protein [Gemmatales bacterium]